MFLYANDTLIAGREREREREREQASIVQVTGGQVAS